MRKGTQAKLLRKRYKIKHISVGELLRKEKRGKTKLGMKIKKIIDKGDLVPDKIVMDIVKKQLVDKFVLDGFPRDLSEAKSLDKLTKLDHVFFLKVTRRVAVRRLSNRYMCDCGMTYNLLTKKPKHDLKCDKCGGKLYRRADDEPKIIKERFKVYKKETKPVIKYYKKKKLLREVNAGKPESEVFKQIHNLIVNKKIYKQN